MKKITLLLCLAFVILLVGCAGSQVEEPKATPIQEAAPIEVAPEISDPLPLAEDTEELVDSSVQIEVSIENFAFVPSDITINKGDTVIWTNNDRAPHNVVFGQDRSPTLRSGDVYEKTFDEAGEFSYICSIHPSMTGKVIVQ
jgi:plastocyanin